MDNSLAAKHSILLSTTVLASSLFGYYRKAYAATCSGSSPTYICSGNYNETITLMPTSGSGLSITATESMQVNTSSGMGIYLYEHLSGAKNITINGDVSSQNHGISL